MTHLTSLRSALLVATAGIMLSACSSDDGFAASDIVAQAPQGQIEGTAWAMTDAEVKRDGDELDIELYAESVEACGFITTGELPSILFSVPAVVGEYPLRFDFSPGDRTATFFEPPSNNIIATEGIIVVESVSATEVTVALIADAGSSVVNGRFTADVCPE